MEEDKQMSKYDTMLDTLSLFFTFWMGVTGVYFIISDRGLFYQSETYQTMAALIPQDGWGILFLIAAVLLFTAVCAEEIIQYPLFIAGGVLTTVLLFLYALASFESELSGVLPYRYFAMSLFSTAIAVLGGVAWRKMHQSRARK